MKPEWRKDPNTHDIQPLELPQFEVAGMQRDHLIRIRAMKWVTRRSLVVGVSILALPIAFLLFNSLDRHRGTFGQFQQRDAPIQQHRIDLRLIKFEKMEEIQGFLFTTKAPAEHYFYIAEIRVTNEGNEDFPLTPYAFALESGGGETFNVDSRTRTLSDDLAASTLSANETESGRLLFSVPMDRNPSVLVLRSMNGQVARVRTP